MFGVWARQNFFRFWVLGGFWLWFCDLLVLVFGFDLCLRSLKFAQFWCFAVCGLMLLCLV